MTVRNLGPIFLVMFIAGSSGSASAQDRTEVRNIVTELKNCGDSESDSVALQMVIDDIVDAYNSQDLERLVSSFHPEVGYLVW